MREKNIFFSVVWKKTLNNAAEWYCVKIMENIDVLVSFHYQARVFLTLVNNTDLIPASSVTSDWQQHQWARGLPCDIIPFAVWKTWHEEV